MRAMYDYRPYEAEGFLDEAEVKKYGAEAVAEAYRALPELMDNTRALGRYLEGMRRIERSVARPVCRQRAPRRSRSAAKKATTSASDGSDGEPDPDGPRVVLTFAAEDDPATRSHVVDVLARMFRDMPPEGEA